MTNTIGTAVPDSSQTRPRAEFAADSAVKPRNLDALTGLRFFAALSVAVYHVPYVLPSAVGATLLPSGGLGVSFFFILSGFILTHVYRGRSFDTGEFYRRRFARIYPLHFLTAVVWIALFFQGWGNPFQEKINSAVANFLLVQAFFSGPLFNLGLNAVSWSISVEALFYVIFPFVRRGFTPLLFLAVCLVEDIGLPREWYSNIEAAFPSFFYFNPFGRLLEFGFGMACYMVYVRIQASYLIAAVAQVAGPVLLVTLVSASAAMPEHYRNALLIFPFGATIVAFALDGPMSRVIGTKPFIVLGESSFAFYMIHHMLFRYIDVPLASLRLPPIFAGLLAFALITAVAIAVHYGFERPARSLLNRTPTVTSPSRRQP